MMAERGKIAENLDEGLARVKGQLNGKGFKMLQGPGQSEVHTGTWELGCTNWSLDDLEGEACQSIFLWVVRMKTKMTYL